MMNDIASANQLDLSSLAAFANLNGNAQIPKPQMQASPVKEEVYSDSDGTKSAKQREKERRKVTHACVNCQKAHISCDNQRPCHRCTEKGLEASCVDCESKKRGRKKIYASVELRPSRKRKYPKHKHTNDNNNSSKKSNNSSKANNAALLTPQQSLQTFPNGTPITNDPFSQNSNGPSISSILSNSSSPSSMGSSDDWDFNQLLDIPGNLSDMLFFPFDLEVFPESSTVPGMISSIAPSTTSPTYSQSLPASSTTSIQQPPLSQQVVAVNKVTSPKSEGQPPSTSPTSSNGVVGSTPAGPAPKIIPPWSESAWLSLLDKNSTVSTCATYYYRMFSFLNDRVYKNYPKEAEEMYTFLMRNKQRLMELKQSLNPDQIVMVKRDFTLYLSNFARAYDQAAVPTVVWERCAVIRYMNQSFKNLTGFPHQIPTELFEFQMLRSVSRASVFHIMSTLRACFLDVNFTSVMLPCALRVWKMPDGKPIEAEASDMGCYIEGTMCITFKRDLLGMPLLSLGQFLPALTSNYQYKYMWEKL